jgi:flavin reductase (DIM6/NTAB) family NADH-FMN oxidoreductase RutF
LNAIDKTLSCRTIALSQTNTADRTIAHSESSLESNFKNAMRRLTSTVCLITTAHEGVWHGMTATAVTSLSMSPCSLLVCINESNAFHSVISQSKHFCVNLLSTQHEELSGVFAGKRKGPARFEVGNWQAHPSGLPFLDDALSSVFCDVDASWQYQTHTIFVGLVRDVHSSESITPLLYQNGGYVGSSPLQSLSL